MVDRASLEARVRAVAMRAMWDSVQAQVDAGELSLWRNNPAPNPGNPTPNPGNPTPSQVDAGEYSGLFSLLGELQQAMGLTRTLTLTLTLTLSLTLTLTLTLTLALALALTLTRHAARHRV